MALSFFLPSEVKNRESIEFQYEYVNRNGNSGALAILGSCSDMYSLGRGHTILTSRELM